MFDNCRETTITVVVSGCNIATRAHSDLNDSTGAVSFKKQSTQRGVCAAQQYFYAFVLTFKRIENVKSGTSFVDCALHVFRKTLPDRYFCIYEGSSVTICLISVCPTQMKIVNILESSRSRHQKTFGHRLRNAK